MVRAPRAEGVPPGADLIVDDVLFQQVLKPALEHGDDDLVHRVLTFIEAMSLGDGELTTLVLVDLLEPLVAEPALLQLALERLGPATRALLDRCHRDAR